MALEVGLPLPPSVVYFITVRAVIRLVVGHIAHSPASTGRCPVSPVLSMFNTDALCLREHNQWYSVDATIDEPLVKIWLLLPQGAGILIGNSQSES